MEQKIYNFIAKHPDIDTRIVIDAFSTALDVPKQKISGYLSSLTKKGQIEITTIKIGEFSTVRCK